MGVIDAPQTLTQKTLDLLREELVNGRFRPGDRLRIDQLGKTYGASTGAVREALSRLTAEGLVIAVPQKGFVVASISRKELSDLTEARVYIESLCIKESMRVGDAAWEGRILSLQHQLKVLGPTQGVGQPVFSAEWRRVHDAFHDALAEACSNIWWLRLRRQLFVQSDRYRRYSVPFDEGDRDVAAEHDAIVAAALGHDEAALEKAVSDHLWGTTKLLLNSNLPFEEDT